MDSASDMTRALRPVVDELNRLGVRYCVGGSVASSVHGAGRSTLDVDLAAELKQPDALALVKSLQNDYYVSESAALEAVRRKSCFNLIHLATSFKVDIFVSRDREFDRSVQDRAISEPFGDVEPFSVRIASAEDIILTKLEWYRLGNEVSERQWSDVTRVAKLQGSRLDCDYLQQWAAELKLQDILERLFAEIEAEDDLQGT